MLSGSGIDPSICIDAVGFPGPASGKQIVAASRIYVGKLRLFRKTSLFLDNRLSALAQASLIREEHLEMARRYCGWKEGITLQGRASFFLEVSGYPGTNSSVILANGVDDELQRKAEALECLKGDVNRGRVACGELKAQVQARNLEEMSASAEVLAFEVQLRLTHDNAKVQADIIEKLESDLSKLQRKAEALEYLKGDVNHGRVACGELKAQMQARNLEEMSASAEVPAFEVKLCLTHDNAKVQADMIEKLESDLSKRKAEALEYLKGDVNHGRVACGELKAQMQARNLEEMSASAEVPAFEVQLCLTHDNAKVQVDMIEKLESDLSKRKAEALEYLKGDVNHGRVACGELKAQMQARNLEEMSASAEVPAFEVQLCLTHDNAKVQADMIEKLESDLSKRKAEALEYLKGDVNHGRVACGELKAQMQARNLEEMSASAEVPAFEVQLCLTHDNAKVQADMIEKLESDLSKVRADNINVRAEATLSQTKADREIAIHMKDVADAQAELKRALDWGKRSEEYSRCRS
ncbi:uncharacterized protein [Nicotiana sylvestris]|uniref:uncharacterized protein n=1 Tax=Nicotiana sylvestris TaxID=4096 RepID=UPI00388C551D